MQLTTYKPLHGTGKGEEKRETDKERRIKRITQKERGMERQRMKLRGKVEERREEKETQKGGKGRREKEDS